MEFIPYKINESFENLYYQIPMELFFNPKYKNSIDPVGKLVYGFLLNRLSLSAKNNWIDNDGNIFLIFTRKEVQEKLNISDKTASKAFKQLRNCKLIYEKKQGANKPNLIYVGKINHDENFMKTIRKNYDSGLVKNTTPDTENLRCNYKYNNYNKKGMPKNNYSNFEQRDYDDLNFLYANLSKN